MLLPNEICYQVKVGKEDIGSNVRVNKVSISWIRREKKGLWIEKDGLSVGGRKLMWAESLVYWQKSKLLSRLLHIHRACSKKLGKGYLLSRHSSVGNVSHYSYCIGTRFFTIIFLKIVVISIWPSDIHDTDGIMLDMMT